MRGDRSDTTSLNVDVDAVDERGEGALPLGIGRLGPQRGQVAKERCGFLDRRLRGGLRRKSHMLPCCLDK